MLTAAHPGGSYANVTDASSMGERTHGPPRQTCCGSGRSFIISAMASPQ
jgi:hypothetical protein